MSTCPACCTWRSCAASTRTRSITGVDVSAARAQPGVVAVYTAEDLGDYWKPGPLLVPPPPVERKVFHQRTQVPLARDKVRHVGEPIVVIVAESRYLAEDAAAHVVIDTEPLPAVVDLERALDADAPRVHDDLDSNVAAHVIQEKGDYELARGRADVIVKRRFAYDRGASCAIENRGVVAHWDPRTQQLDGLGHDPGADSHPQRPGRHARAERVAGARGRAVHRRRLRAQDDDVLSRGGGAAVDLDAPGPAGQVDRGSRGELLRDHAGARAGARGRDRADPRRPHPGRARRVPARHRRVRLPTASRVPINTQCTLLGCYDIEHYYSEFTAVFTNKTIVTPYRGAGRPHGVFVMERLLDLAARELGIDRVEIRKRNLIAPDAVPLRQRADLSGLHPPHL